MRKNAIAVGAAAIFIALASPASAQGMGPGGGMGGMGMGMWQGVVGKLCVKDIETHCAGIGQGPGQRACLEGKSKELSENCRRCARVHGAGSWPRNWACCNALHERDRKFCPEVEHAFGQVRNCLNAHSGELGEACTVALDNTGPRWHN